MPNNPNQIHIATKGNNQNAPMPNMPANIGNNVPIYMTNTSNGRLPEPNFQGVNAKIWTMATNAINADATHNLEVNIIYSSRLNQMKSRLTMYITNQLFTMFPLIHYYLM